MSTLPLLFFPKPTLQTKSKRHGGGDKINYPSKESNINKHESSIQQIQNAFLSSSPAGADTEKVLVIQIIGRIEKFQNAVKQVEGLDWLFDQDLDDLQPNEEYFYENPKDKSKSLPRKLFLIASNKKGAENLCNLWRKYKAGENFERGTTKWRDIFTCLHEIRFWGAEDRFDPEHFKEILDDKIHFYAGTTQREFYCEIELWNSKNENNSNKQRSDVINAVQDLGGTFKTQCLIKDIEYFGLLVSLPINSIQRLIDEFHTISLLTIEGIQYIRPHGQASFISNDKEEYEELHSRLSQYLDNEQDIDKKPVIALIDGYPVSNNPLIQNRIIVDDVNGFEQDCPLEKRFHGTAMASLILWGDLNCQDESPLDTTLYSIPVMKPNNSPDQVKEFVPEDELFIEIIHRSVKRIFEGENRFAASIKIINLSVGNSLRPYDGIISPLARLLDWLSWKHNVLFIISAGNSNSYRSIKIENQSELDNPSNMQKKVVKQIHEDSYLTKILSPSESINSITVGAIHEDKSNYSKLPPNIYDPFSASNIRLPSPISMNGLGVNRSIKPDILVEGGKHLFCFDANNSVFKPCEDYSRFGQKVIATKINTKEKFSTRLTTGTSNSTALATRRAFQIYKNLKQLSLDNSLNIPEEYFPTLIKTLLVHGCSWEEAFRFISEVLEIQDKKEAKNICVHLLGNGFLNFKKSLINLNNKVTCIGFGKIGKDQANEFSFPLPPSIGSKSLWKRLTTTLAWITPVNPSDREYKGSHLWLDIPNKPGLLDIEPFCPDQYIVKRGTVQHEIFEGDKADVIGDESSLKIKVNCVEKAGKIIEPIRFGLAVTLEVKDEIHIFNEIQQRIRQQVREEALVKINT